MAIIKLGGDYNHSNHMEIQLDCTASDTDVQIKAELDALPICAPGSVAYSATFDLICSLKNDGTWQINR